MLQRQPGFAGQVNWGGLGCGSPVMLNHSRCAGWRLLANRRHSQFAQVIGGVRLAWLAVIAVNAALGLGRR
jgi:hypothetical protein